MAKPYGIVIRGMSTGTNSFKNKNNIDNYQLLLVVPGSNGVIQVSLPGAPKPDQYPVGQEVELSCIPTFYNGRVSGFRIIQP